MNRQVYILAASAFVIVALSTPFQVLGVPLAPVAALLLGGIGGWWVVNYRGEHDAASGFKGGALVGAAAMLGSIVGLAVLALFVTNIPEVQTYIQNSEPNAEARIPSEWIAPLGALAGLVVGFVMGLVDLVVAAIAGLVAGAVSKGNHVIQN